MLSLAQSKQKSLSVAWQGSVSLVRSLKKDSGSSPAAARGRAQLLIRLLSAQRPLRRAALLDLRRRRDEELGDDLDREDAVDPPVAVGDRRVLGAGLEDVGERVAHHVVEFDDGPERRVRAARHSLRIEVALGEPAQGAPLVVDE